MMVILYLTKFFLRNQPDAEGKQHAFRVIRIGGRLASAGRVSPDEIDRILDCPTRKFAPVRNDMVGLTQSTAEDTKDPAANTRSPIRAVSMGRDSRLFGTDLIFSSSPSHFLGTVDVPTAEA